MSKGRKSLAVVKQDSPRASVSVAIIARNASRTIGNCVRSLAPYVAEVVVCVDETTTDDTAHVAKVAGARVVKGLKVSEPHECPQHGSVLAQHFARARDWSFARTDPQTEWLMWVDADDVVRGAEKLPEFVRRIPPEVDVVWLPYHYASTPNGATSTLFDRERLLRRRAQWGWQFRVHEVAQPAGRPMESLGMLRSDEIQIWHASEGHDTAGSARRNITLLEIDLEENPEDQRAWFYLGNQWFALGEWQKAAAGYLRALDHDNTYQLWQTYIYLSMTFEKLGDLEQAKAMAYQAIDVAPFHPEPYYRLAALDGLLRNDLARAEYWTRLGDEATEAPAFAFRNPLDRPFNARVTLANAYALNGYASRARRELERAAQVVPAPEVLQGIERHKGEEQDILRADATVATLAPALASGRMTAQLAREIADPVWHVGRVRDLVVPTLLKGRPNSQPRIVFMCGRSAEPWAPPSIETTGIGGSETAVIKIAKRFAREGWRVDVYNEPDRFEGEYEGVGYWGNARIAPGERAEVMVAWRQAGFIDLPVERRLSLLWMHDLHAGPGQEPNLRRWDKVLAVSGWHAGYLSQMYGLENTGFVPNGIDLERFAQPVKKVPFRAVYASSPDRGLDRLLDLWPHIVAAEPTAELHLAYGWETIDRYIQLGNAALAPFKARLEEQIKNTKRVVWRGRLNQNDLAQLYAESYAWLYPTSFTEVSCISAMEAMAGGAVPVCSSVGALPETIGEAGVIVTGNTYSPAWKEFWIACAKAVLLSPPERKPREAIGKERATRFTWDKAFEKWLEVVGEIQPAAPKRLLEVVK